VKKPSASTCSITVSEWLLTPGVYCKTRDYAPTATSATLIVHEVHERKVRDVVHRTHAIVRVVDEDAHREERAVLEERVLWGLNVVLRGVRLIGSVLQWQV
jgi:hypothetical protein